MNVVLAEYLTFLLLIEKRRVSFKRCFFHFATLFRFLLSPPETFLLVQSGFAISFMLPASPCFS